MEQKGFYLAKYGANDNLQNERRRTKKQLKQNNPHLQKRDPGSGSLFPYHPKSPQNPIKSSKNLPISCKNRFLPDMYVGNISCHYPNYVTYDIIIFQICHIRHNLFSEICHIRHNNLLIMSSSLSCLISLASSLISFMLLSRIFSTLSHILNSVTLYIIVSPISSTLICNSSVRQ